MAWCENGCGGIQSPTAHGGDDKCWTVGQGKCVLSQHGTENLELAMLVAALGRRKLTEDSSEMGNGVQVGQGLVRAGEANRLVTSAAQRICMVVVAVTGANSVCRQGRSWVLGAGA